MLQEMISEGQRVERFMVEALAAGRWTEVARATTIGYKRLLRFPGVTADRVRVTILESRDSPAIREFGLYRSSSREASPPDRR
jgi:alpha-L-fucosidase